jgi:hypothetical protein
MTKDRSNEFSLDEYIAEQDPSTQAAIAAEAGWAKKALEGSMSEDAGKALPPPTAYIHQFESSDDRLAWERASLPVRLNIPLFTADQMRSYVLQAASSARMEERERCAKLCDEYATWGGSNFYDWFKKCASAIRSDPSKDQG